MKKWQKTNDRGIWVNCENCFRSFSSHYVFHPHPPMIHLSERVIACQQVEKILWGNNLHPEIGPHTYLLKGNTPVPVLHKQSPT